MNNSTARSTTSSTANGLWLQVMKLVSGPVLIFPRFLYSQCKWRGINLRYWFAGLSEVLIVALVTAGGTRPPFPTALRLLAPVCLREGLVFALFSLLVHQPAAFRRSRGCRLKASVSRSGFRGFFSPPLKPKCVSGRRQKQLAGRSPREHTTSHSFCDPSAREHLWKYAQNKDEEDVRILSSSNLVLQSYLNKTHLPRSWPCLETQGQPNSGLYVLHYLEYFHVIKCYSLNVAAENPKHAVGYSTYTETGSAPTRLQSKIYINPKANIKKKKDTKGKVKRSKLCTAFSYEIKPTFMAILLKKSIC